jgi:hypothetical protein
MYVVVNHHIKDPQTAFARGARLIQGEGAPDGARALQFLPATDGSAVTCLWEAPSVGAIQAYVDTALGDSSVNACYELNAEQAFAARADGIATSPALPA